MDRRRRLLIPPQAIVRAQILIAEVPPAHHHHHHRVVPVIVQVRKQKRNDVQRKVPAVVALLRQTETKNLYENKTLLTHETKNLLEILLLLCIVNQRKCKCLKK